MTELEFKYKKLRLAQDLTNSVLKKVGLCLMRCEDNIFIHPDKEDVIKYINRLAKERKVKHYLLKNDRGNEVILFEPEELLLDLEIHEIERIKEPKLIKVQIMDKKTSVSDNVPYEISAIKELMHIPESTFNSGSCIYFLCHKGNIVYIGQSENVHQRLNEHRKTKVFDDVFYFRCPVNKLLKFESALISYLKPALNKAGMKIESNAKISLARDLLNIT